MNCAMNRSILDLRGDTAYIEAGNRPVYISEIEDQRIFVSDRVLKENKKGAVDHGYESHSLGFGDKSDPALRERAIARKRNGMGEYCGDILLPEGHSVKELVRDVAIDALHQKGYRIVDFVPDNSSALPFKIIINHFWGSFLPEMRPKIVFTAKLTMVSPILIHSDDNVAFTQYTKKMGVFELASTKTWKQTMLQGMDDLSKQITLKLKAAEALAE